MRGLGLSKYLASQSAELNMGGERLPGLRLDYFEGGSFDARESMQLSEDFFCYLYKDRTFCFIVCDGVGQSEDAGFAANLFGRKMLEPLLKAIGRKEYIEGIAAKLRTSISDEINRLPLRHDNPKFHLRARNELGAQVKFTCGVLDFRRKVVEIFWAGDVRFILFDRKLKIINSWGEDNNQFWSTKGDYALDLSFFSVDLDRVSRVFVTSDGMREPFERLCHGESYLNSFDFVTESYTAGKDDVSGIDVQIIPNDVSGSFPALSRVETTGGRVNWVPLEGAEKYRLYFTDNGYVTETLDLSANNSSFSIPTRLQSHEVFVQAIASRVISGPIVKALPLPAPEIDTIATVSPTPLQIQPGDPQKGPIDSSSQAVDRIEIAPPNRKWIKALAYSIVSLMLITIFIGIGRYLGNGFPFTPPIPSRTLRSPSPATFTVNTEAAEKSTIAPTATIPLETVILTSTMPSEITMYPTGLVTVMLTSSPPVENSTPIPGLEYLNNCQKGNYSSSQVIYQIQAGDTLYALSREYDVSVEELRTINCLTDNLISTGKYLLIPIKR